MKKSILALPLLLIAFSAHAELEEVASWESKDLNASIRRDGNLTFMAWSTLLNASLEDVQKVLVDWGHARSVVSGTQKVMLKNKTEKGAFLRVERKAPFFFPDVWYEIRTTTAQKNRKTHVIWNYQSGSGDHYRREWVLQQEGSKTRVVHTFELGLPYDLPNVFVKSRLT